MLAEWGAYNVVHNNLVGVEAMFYTYLNVWVFLLFLMGIMGAMAVAE